jgi:hypothetical protein
MIEKRLLPLHPKIRETMAVTKVQRKKKKLRMRNDLRSQLLKQSRKGSYKNPNGEAATSAE